MPAFKPPGWPSVIPRIVVPDPEQLVAFLTDVFGAHARSRPGAPTELRIGESLIIVSDGGGLRDPICVFLYVYVEDIDSTYARAIAAGAHSLEPPADMPYGDRRAMIKDSFGNLWQIATYQPSGSPTSP
jgi:uncharacterized glyoxalase superfamily protein PhnB